ncbi:MAG TPA: OpgC domain-containing protein [Acidobacteriaceae bacterium]|nr:OpgC domain-containing protein [Acidobacteriaceae bacterium]
MDVKSASRTVLRLGKIQRRPELDALRGLFLVWMTLTHLPTRMSEIVNQPFGFVSSAEGFVFLSAMLVATLYIHQVTEDSEGVRTKLWKRALRIYGYHLIMLAMVFTVVAAFAVHTHRAAIYNLLNFYLAHPGTAIVGSLLLIYCPPLLDILPMYVTFLLLTPYVLNVAVRRGWGVILAASGLVWVLAQFGLRTWVHTLVVHITGLHIPLQETGAFNLFAWQTIWILALWLGAKSSQGENPLSKLPGFVFPLSMAVCLFFLGVRHDWLGPRLTQEALGLSLDKWQIGPLRLVNLFAFSCVVYASRNYLTKVVLVEPLLTLGKASLEVFCAHLFFVFVGLALLYGEVTELHGPYALALLIITFSGLILVAIREVRRKQQARRAPPTTGTDKEHYLPGSGLTPPPAERRAEV